MLNWLNTNIWTPVKTWWVEKIWAPSWTRFTTMIYGIPAALVTIGQYVSNFANDTTIGNYLSQLNVPNWVPMTLAGIALVHYVAHGHSDSEI